jgi:hypothetical protein
VRAAGHAEEGGEGLDAGCAVCGDLLDGSAILRGRRHAAELGLLGVRRVVAGVADHDRVLADVGDERELLRALAADRARVGLKPDRGHAASARRCCGTAWNIAAYELSRPASSRSNEYASFIVNSRTRISPPRGRCSSRNLFCTW